MSLLKAKAKFSKDAIQNSFKEDEQGTRGDDARFLNYFDMDFGQKMSIIIMPDENGLIFHKYNTHGGRKLKLPRGTKGRPQQVGCNRMNHGGECAICDEMFDQYNKADGDKKSDAHKTANRLQTTETILMSCVVIDSPVEVKYPEDGNRVKLVRVPSDVYKRIKADIDEGEIDPEEDLSSIPFILRKTKGDGDFAAYDTSGFSRNPITEEDEAKFEGQVIELYDFHDLDEKLTPKEIDEEEQKEWVAKALELFETVVPDDSKGGKGNAKDNKDVKDKLSSKLGKKTVSEDDPEDGQEDPEDGQEEDNQEEAVDDTPKKKSALGDRLSKFRKK